MLQNLDGISAFALLAEDGSVNDWLARRRGRESEGGGKVSEESVVVL